MQERRGPGHGDITGETRGDFTDWDNPEDQWDAEDAPEGYYDGEDDGSYIPDESDPDYDLSEAHGYAGWEPSRGSPIPSWLIAAGSILLIIAILIPILLRLS
jgi:hypothetical protein